MKKYERVKSNILFNQIIQNGKKCSNNLFTIFYDLSDNYRPLIGISVPKKCGNAVVRNRLKRQTRQLVDEIKLLFKNNRNYIIIVKDRCIITSYVEKLSCLKNLVGEINEK